MMAEKLPVQVRKRHKTHCTNCRKVIYRYPYERRKFKRSYCSNSCQLKYEYANGLKDPIKSTQNAHQKSRELAKDGKHHSQKPAVRKRFIQSMTGPNNPNWTDYKSVRSFLSKSERKRILKRDNYECQNCGYEQQLEVHHIKRWKDGGTHSPSNLITLCHTCHWDIHRKLRGYDWQEKKLKKAEARSG